MSNITFCKDEIAKYFDHTILKPEAKKEAVLRLCKEAMENKVASVCVNPVHILCAVEFLRNSDVKVCTVIGFPLGANTVETKVFESCDAIKKGAQEIDMVLNIGALKDSNYSMVEDEIRQVVEVCKGKALLKVIIETCLLSDEEKIQACQIAQRAGADYVKTSTGFNTSGATVEDIALMRKTVGEHMGVKASGGIRTVDDVINMIHAGASRIGSGSTNVILSEML